MSVKEKEKCVPIINPHHWDISGELVVKQAVIKGKLTDIRYHKAICRKCGEQRLLGGNLLNTTTEEII